MVMVVVGVVVVESPSSLMQALGRAAGRSSSPPDGAAVCVVSPTEGARPLRV
jgi:hypothetical protein